jgi:hypothetical protein
VKKRISGLRGMQPPATPAFDQTLISIRVRYSLEPAMAKAGNGMPNAGLVE